MRVIQGIVVHDVLGRPKIVLDQLRQGLNTLGFGDKMVQHPDLFEELFMKNHKEIQAQDVLDVFEFPLTMSSDETNTKNYLTSYLNKATPEAIKKFLVFSTGCPMLPKFGFGRIVIEFENLPSIFASTCLQTVTFPCMFPDEKFFISSFTAVLNTSGTGRSFNCV